LILTKRVGEGRGREGESSRKASKSENTSDTVLISTVPKLHLTTFVNSLFLVALVSSSTLESSARRGDFRPLTMVVNGV